MKLWNLLAIRSFYKNIEAEQFMFDAEFYLAKTCFRLNVLKNLSVMQNYVQARKQQQKNYYKQNQENIKNSNKMRYRQSLEENRSAPQGKPVPAPPLPPLKRNKNKGRKEKQRIKSKKVKRSKN